MPLPNERKVPPNSEILGQQSVCPLCSDLHGFAELRLALDGFFFPDNAVFPVESAGSAVCAFPPLPGPGTVPRTSAVDLDCLVLEDASVLHLSSIVLG